MALRVFYLLMAAVSLLNGTVMIVRPSHWFHEMIPGVPNTGPFNPHFVMDVGIAFVTCGVGFAWAAFHLARAREIHWGITLFISGHAVFHVVEILRGALPPEHWRHDLVGVFIPGAILLALCIPAVWRWANPAWAAANPPGAS
jgi:hypothetical protein